MVETPKVPPATNLARDSILQSMLDHVSEYENKYPLVKIDILKESVLKKIIDAPQMDNDTEFDPEVQLRGFLQTFEHTPAFKAEFNILDDATKKQISAFKSRMNWKNTIKHGFGFPGFNPNASKVLTAQSSSPSLFIRIQDFFLRGFVGVAGPFVRLLVTLQMGRATKRLKEAQATIYAGGPKIYEDDSEEKVMDVRFDQINPSCTVLILLGFLWPAFPELGTVCQQQAKIHLCPDHSARDTKSCALRQGEQPSSPLRWI